MDAVRHDDEYVQVAVRPHLATCGRAEQDDPPRLRDSADAAQELRYRRLRNGVGRFHPHPPSGGNASPSLPRVTAGAMGIAAASKPVHENYLGK
jgi:hypothetical protein